MLRGFLRRSQEEKSKLTTVLRDREVRENNSHRQQWRVRRDLESFMIFNRL